MNTNFERFFDIVKRDWEENQPDYYVTLIRGSILDQKAKSKARLMFSEYKDRFNKKSHKTKKPQSDLIEKEVLIKYVPKLYAKLIEEDLNREILSVIDMWKIRYDKFPKKIDLLLSTFAPEFFEFGKSILRKTTLQRRWKEKEILIDFVLYYVNGLVDVHTTKGEELEISAWFWSSHERLNWRKWYDFYISLDSSQKESILDGESIDDQSIKYFLQKLRDYIENVSPTQKKIKSNRPTKYNYGKIFVELKKLKETNKKSSTSKLLSEVVKSQKLGGDRTTIIRWILHNKRYLPNSYKYMKLTPIKILDTAPLEDLLLMVDKSKIGD